MAICFINYFKLYLFDMGIVTDKVAVKIMLNSFMPFKLYAYRRIIQNSFGLVKAKVSPSIECIARGNPLCDKFVCPFFLFLNHLDSYLNRFLLMQRWFNLYKYNSPEQHFSLPF